MPIGVYKHYPRIPAFVRFWNHVLLQPESGCWLWIGTRTWNGYGRMSYRNRGFAAHRFVKIIQTGKPIPDNMEIDHLCRNRWCVNPEHLDIVTKRENMRRSPLVLASLNEAKTHCPKGHPYSKTNTRWRMYKNGRQRVCRICDVLRSRAYKARTGYNERRWNGIRKRKSHDSRRIF